LEGDEATTSGRRTVNDEWRKAEVNKTTLRTAAEEFLSHRRIAVAGVARNGASAANYVYQRLREIGYEVYPVNPNAAEVEGDRC